MIIMIHGECNNIVKRIPYSHVYVQECLWLRLSKGFIVDSSALSQVRQFIGSF